MTHPLLTVEHLTKIFPADRHSNIVAVNDVSLSIERGQTLGLVGESGSGKTTVGRCLLRLIEPSGGWIVFDGVDITRLSDRALRPFRARMQLVFQDHAGSLNPRMSVEDHLAEPLTLRGDSEDRSRIGRVQEILGAVGLDSKYLPRYPGDLTASEQQRVGIARAIVTQPDLIVLDEPTSNLDPTIRAEILNLLIDLQNRFGTAYLFISHDLTAVQALSHRIAIMYLGRIVEVASSDAIQSKQFHPYSAALLSAVLYPDPERKLEPFMLEGEIPSPIDPPDECSLAPRCPFAIPICRSATPHLQELTPEHWSACYRSSEFVERGVPRGHRTATDIAHGAEVN